MIEILGNKSSINVRKVIWTCHELDIKYNLDMNLDLVSQLNPNSLSPIICDNKLVLWESNTILRYLAEAYSGEALYPSSPFKRAQINQWIDWQATEFNNSWRYAFQALVRKNPQYDDTKAINTSLQEWSKHIEILDRQIEKNGSYVVGNQFSLADIPLGLSVNRWFKTPEYLDKYPAVRAYYEHLLQRPIFKSLCEYD